MASHDFSVRKTILHYTDLCSASKSVGSKICAVIALHMQIFFYVSSMGIIFSFF